MTWKFRDAAAAWAIATLLASAVDLAMSAANGYILRVDAGLLLAWELLGIALLSGAAVVGLLVLLVLARARAPMPATICLAAAWAPIALNVVWRHREPALLVAVAIAAVAILVVAAIEARGRWRVAHLAAATVAVIVSVGAIAASIALPLRGRDMIPPPAARAVAEPAGPNLLFIVLDTLRADRAGGFGYDRALMPWLEGFAKSATVYERAVASSSYTLPTHATFFTGLYAETHGAIESKTDTGLSLKALGLQADWANVSPLPDEAETLAELMAARGYETAAICANSAYLARAFNLDQGFATYVDATGSRKAWRPTGISMAGRLPIPEKWRFDRLLESNERYYLFAHEINALTRHWLRGRNDRPYFLFLNYMEPHHPYLPLPGYRDRFPNSYARQTADLAAIAKRERDLTPEEKAQFVDAYDAEIMCLDDRLRELFAMLEAAGALKNTIVVIASDHGESFSEHGLFGHAVSVYEPEVWVPLIVRAPRQTAGDRVRTIVHTADVMPTLLRELGMPVPEAVEGTVLAAAPRKVPIVSSLGPYEREFSEYAVYSDPWKLLWRSDAPPALYHLREDPAESVNRANDQRAVVEALLKLLDAYHARPGKRLTAGPLTMDADTRERLKAIGYVK